MKTNFNKNLFSSKSDDFANKYLNHFLQFSIKSAADYDEENKWITNSKQIKNLTELKGIINLNKSNGKYIKKSDCNSRHPLLNVNHSFNTERTAAKIVDNFDILLKYSNRIVFVDRYFDITKSYCTNIINEIKSRIGVKASDLLQSNCVIWVEGPSDRIYIKKWIELFDGHNLEEGLDYQFIYYEA